MSRTRDDRPIPTENEALLDRALGLYQPRYPQRLTREDAREIVYNLTGFFGVLRDWERRAAGREPPPVLEPEDGEQ